MSKEGALRIHIDGAARGNPGPAAYAYVIAQDDQPVIEEAGALGRTTNNVAEYTALVKALERAAGLGGKRLLVKSDSELLVKQMNGAYRVKNEQLKELFGTAKQLCRHFDLVSIQHVPRAENSQADRLCNEVLDGVYKSGGKVKSTKPAPAKGPALTRSDLAHEEAKACLAAAAAVWARGNATDLSPALVWDQLWSILEEHGLVRPAR